MVRDRAIQLLARREHSRKELRDKLVTRKLDKTEIENVLSELADQNLLSDERFTEVYVRHRTSLGFGPRRIRAELQQKGISASLIDQYLSQQNSFWWEALSTLWHRKYHDQGTVDANEYAKRARFLIQRGFEIEMVSRWLKLKKSE